MADDTARPVMRATGVLCAVVAVQGLVSLQPLRPSVLIIHGSDRQGSSLAAPFQRGFEVALEEAADCGHASEPVGITALPALADPEAALAQDPRAGAQLTLVVAPPGADPLAYGRWARRRSVPVLLPLTRGPALDALPTASDRDHLWLLSPARSEGLASLAESALDLNWRRIMLVEESGSSDSRRDSAVFLDRYEAAGGLVVSAGGGPVQSVGSGDGEGLDRLVADVDWLQPDAVAVIASSTSPLLTELSERLSGQSRWWSLGTISGAPAVPGTLAPSLALDAGSRGPGWTDFAERFMTRWVELPGPVEAAGYDAGVMTVLAMADPGSLDPSDWLDPEATPVPLCEGLRLRAEQQRIRPNGASSEMNMRPGRPPDGRFDVSYQAL
ncbi:hypothetical protein EVJ50_02960 [Synechococcus sp. RSCCF101]|uniref:hypothetical protein n=1 Tax=Synechococcus sp. RSCCF101 TaxID=2511069 RepID=UPI0012469D61|nr:hypothetical protein [Synechococcus sp. RSCCF101]QEY31367.1 hypothetical protein EVJ50_02960 [Synechococcus sp. RSCCF101]